MKSQLARAINSERFEKKHRKYPREKHREYGEGVSGSLRSRRWTWQAFTLVGYKFVTGLLVQFSENEIAKK